MNPIKGLGSQESKQAKARWIAHLPLWVVFALGALVMFASDEPAVASLGVSKITVGKVSGPGESIASAAIHYGPGSATDAFDSFTLTDLGTAPSETRIKPYVHDLSIADIDPRRASPLEKIHGAVPVSTASSSLPDMVEKHLPDIKPYSEPARPVEFIQPELELAPIHIVSLRDQQQNITDYLSRFYRRSNEKVRKYVRYAFESADRNGVDPLLVLGIMSIESSLNPKARSHKDAKGLMQVLVKAHVKRFKQFGGTKMAYEPRVSIEVGTRIIAGMLNRVGTVQGALKRYVGAANMKTDGGYGAKVIGMRERIWAASVGHPVPKKPDMKLAVRRANLAQSSLKPALKTAQK